MQPHFDFALVTGANGWLGKRFVRLLAKNGIEHEASAHISPRLRIRGMILPGSDSSELRELGPRVEVIEGDLRNPADCTRFLEGAKGACVFHTAGVIHPRRVKDFYAINVQGVRNLLAAAEQTRVRRVVAVSSNSALGCNPHQDHLFDESSPYNPYMNYGRSKMQMELAIKEAESRRAIETVIVRPPWFYGPDQPLRQTLFFSMIRKGKGPIVGGGGSLRSMGYVDNLCQGLLLAAVTEDARGQTYWIADERPYTMNEVIDTVERLLTDEFHLPVAHKRMRLPGVASEAAQLADWTLQKMGLYHPKIHVLSEMNKTIAASIDKAKRELGYKPRVALEEGMRRSIAWCIGKGIAI